MREKIAVIDEEGSGLRPFRVFFADGILGSAAEKLQGVEGIEFSGQDKTSKKQLEEILAREGDDAVDALIIRSATKLAKSAKRQKPGVVVEDPAALFAKAKALGLVIRAGIGTDNIDEIQAAQSGKVVENTPEGNVKAVVVKTINDIVFMSSPQFKGRLALQTGNAGKLKWSENTEPFKDKKFGVVGLGNIGGRVAQEIIKHGGKVPKEPKRHAN